MDGWPLTDDLATKFRYLTAPLRPCPSSLRCTPLLHARAFHLIATPSEIMRQVPQLLSLRAELGIKDRPLIVWEPIPASCTRCRRNEFLKACELVDVFSPNHVEMMALFSPRDPVSFQERLLEVYVRVFLAAGVGRGGNGGVIIRYVALELLGLFSGGLMGRYIKCLESSAAMNVL